MMAGEEMWQCVQPGRRGQENLRHRRRKYTPGCGYDRSLQKIDFSGRGNVREQETRAIMGILAICRRAEKKLLEGG